MIMYNIIKHLQTAITCQRKIYVDHTILRICDYLSDK